MAQNKRIVPKLLNIYRCFAIQTVHVHGGVDGYGGVDGFHNPDFNYLEFEAIEREAGLNSFVLTPKRWVEQTKAKGFLSIWKA